MKGMSQMKTSHISALGMALSAAIVCCLVIQVASAGDVETDNLTVNTDASVYGKLEVMSAEASVATTNGWNMYYSFSTNTTPVPDDSGNSNTGIVNGATWTSSGLLGGGYDFYQDYINCGSSSDVLPTNNFSVSHWVKFDSFHNYYLATAIWPNRNGYLFLSASTYMRFRVQGQGTYSDANDVTAPETGTWYHIVGVYSNQLPYLYVNGVLKASGTTSLQIEYAGNAELYLGDEKNSTLSNDYLDGKLDEVYVFNRALSAEEISALYHAGYASDEAGRVEFNDGVEYTAPLGDIPMGSYTNQP